MTRTATCSDRRPLAFASAILVLGLAACGGGREDPSRDLVQTPVGSTPVVPTGGPATVTPTTAVERRAVTYEEAESVFKEGKYGEAKDLFATYVEGKPGNPWGHYMLGLSAWKAGDFRGAETAFDRALELDPKHVKSLLNSARVLMDLKRDGEALERVKEALELDSTSTEGLRLLARAHHRLGAVDSAVEAYRQALIRDDRDVWAMNNLGMLYIEQKDPASAVPPLARAVTLRPTSPIFQNNLGMALELTGHLVEAKQAYDAAVRADSSYAKAVANAERLGDIVTDPVEPSGFVRDQAELFRQLVKLWPKP
jgi:predicted Zn-dependent protease